MPCRSSTQPGRPPADLHDFGLETRERPAHRPGGDRANRSSRPFSPSGGRGGERSASTRLVLDGRARPGARSACIRAYCALSAPGRHRLLAGATWSRRWSPIPRSRRASLRLFRARFDPRRPSDARGARGRHARRRSPPRLDKVANARRRPHPPPLPQPRRGDAAHQLLPTRRRPAAEAISRVQARQPRRRRPAAAAADGRDLRLFAGAWRASTCAAARSRAAASAGRTGARTSAPRSSA